MNTRQLKDKFAQRIMFLLCIFVLMLVFFIVLGLYFRARSVILLTRLFPLLFSFNWHPAKGQFGLASFILGSLSVTSIAMIIAVPLSILTAIYLSEYANTRFRNFTKPLIDLLSGISPVIYGVWGIIVIVPFVRDYLMPYLSSYFPFYPFKSDNFTGFSALSAGIVLAIMSAPIIISVAHEVLHTTPLEIREASLALGATKWETIKFAVLNNAWPGIIAAIILGLSRAFGETMAVLMVAGCAMSQFPKSIFDSAYPLPALIANTYGEMMSIPFYDAAILLAALILLLITIFFNIIGWAILFHIEKRSSR